MKLTPPATACLATSSLISYSKDFWGSKEVIAYGKKIDNNLEMKIYDEASATNYKTISNPSLEDIIPYLKLHQLL